MPEIVARATFDRKYTGIAKFPAVTRDISMVMPKEILVGQIEDVIESKGGEYLESYSLFDIYEGAQIKTGFKSVAYSIVFRAKDKTLEDADVSAAMDRILKALEVWESNFVNKKHSFISDKSSDKKSKRITYEEKTDHRSGSSGSTVRWSQCCQRIYQYNFKKSCFRAVQMI